MVWLLLLGGEGSHGKQMLSPGNLAQLTRISADMAIGGRRFNSFHCVSYCDVIGTSCLAGVPWTELPRLEYAEPFFGSLGLKLSAGP